MLLAIANTGGEGVNCQSDQQRSGRSWGGDLSVALVTEGEITRCKKPQNYEALPCKDIQRP
jgi:hypothetical protein